jgi:hypothetical protein
MTALSIQPTFPIFTDIDGQPLEDGYVFIGTANLQPIGNPITVYWDAALTLPAAQPIRTRGGYPINSGTPARLYVNSDYSIQVQNKNGSVVYSAPAATERYGNIISSADVSFLQAGTGAVTRTAQAKMREVVSVTDFGAVGDGVTNDTAAIQAAIDYVATINGATVYLPPGVYKTTSTLSFNSHSTRLVGNNRGMTPGTYAVSVGGSRINYTGANYAVSFNGKHYCEVADLTIASTTANGGIYIGDIAHYFRVSRVVIDGQSSGTATGFPSAGIAIERSYYGTIEGCDIVFCAGNGIYGFRECNGNFIQMNSIRQCGTGIRITDDSSNTDGTAIISNEIESARTDPGSAYGISLLGADSMMVVGNRIEWTANGHIFINSNVGIAQFNQLIGNVLEGAAPAIILGDGTGSSQVVGTMIVGGRAATAVTINSDVAGTFFQASPGAYPGTFTDSGYGSNIDIDVTNNKSYRKTAASNTVKGYQLSIGGVATTLDTGTNYLDVKGTVGVHSRFETSGLLRVAQGSLAAGGDSGGTAGCNTLSNQSNTAARSTGVGTVKFADATARDNVGFIKVYVGTTAYWVPIFAAG